ncbi:hypothetical protein N7499_013046 [Penicillium canescens]|nr:hypothetical protein N7522_002340 [Penicillium canescens]KAJ6064366.1 hypothetical protein N7499_013046 [Penicillium canescens]KAJ6154136.1 hypothetical protein N7485_012505 [Penicillium canescens]
MILARAIVCNQRVEETRSHTKHMATANIPSEFVAITQGYCGINCVLHIGFELDHVELRLEQLWLKL